MFLLVLGAAARAEAHDVVDTKPKPQAPLRPMGGDPRCPMPNGLPPEAPAHKDTPEGKLAALTIEGRFFESQTRLLSVIDTQIPRRCPPGSVHAACDRVWSGTVENAVAKLLEKDLGYHVAFAVRRVERLGRHEYTVRINVAPIAKVRHVVIGTSWPVFEDEITRRIHLRAGSPVPDTRCAREALLREEQTSVRDYLIGRGYFDARVFISFDETNPDELALKVNVTLGPTYTVGTVGVDGALAISPTSIRDGFGQKTWYSWLYQGAFSRDHMKNDARNAEQRYRDAGFPGARVRVGFDPVSDLNRRKHTVNLHVTVRERRRVAVSFLGNRSVSSASLAKVLTFDTEGAYDDYEAERSAEAIFHEYQLRGYFEAQVQTTRQRFPEANYDSILFQIHEGPRRELRTIEFTGNQSFSAAQLGKVIGTRPYQVGILQAQDLFTSTQLSFDVDRLREFYRKQGFAKTEVSYDVAPAPWLLDRAGALAAVATDQADDPGQMVLRYHVVEGPRDLVAAVIFRGVTVAEARKLGSVVGFRAGSPFAEEAPGEGRAKLEHYFDGQGYLYARIEVAVKPGPRTGERLVTYQIWPGEIVHWGQILVRGNFKTRTGVILRELPFGPGDRYNPDQIEQGEQRLRALGLFNSVRLSFVGVDQRSNPLTVIVEVEERYDYSADLEFAIGSATDNIFFVSAALIGHNLAGWGHELRGGFELGFEVRAFDAAYTVPRLYLTHTPITFRASAFVRQEDTARLGTLFSFGGSLAFSRELARNFFASLRYDIRQVNRSVPLVRGAGHDEDLDSIKVASRTGDISAQVVWDKRNDPLLPSSGFRLSGTSEFAANIFGGTDDFIKLSATGSQFWSPHPRMLLAQGLRFDYGIPLSGVLLPAVERLYAGGDTTVRGFEEDRLFTEIVAAGVGPLPRGKFQQFQALPQGGNIRILHNIDFQVDVLKLYYPVAMGVFLDTGVVTNSLREFRITDLRHSLGLAFFRYRTPFGFASFEYAIPLDPQLGDDVAGRFHFNFGFVF